VTSWKSYTNEEGTARILRDQFAFSNSPPLDYWGYAQPGAPNTKCSQYWYQETVNTKGKYLLISGFWGSLVEPQLWPHQSELDEARCFHSHVSYYVWGSTDFGEHFVFVGGGGKSGHWNGSFCDINSHPDPAFPEIHLTWGTDSVVLPNSEFDVIVVGVQATSHWGEKCGQFECYHPVHAVVVSKND
jgi:hypothetical protein